MVVLSSWLL